MLNDSASWEERLKMKDSCGANLTLSIINILFELEIPIYPAPVQLISTKL